MDDGGEKEHTNAAAEEEKARENVQPDGHDGRDKGQENGNDSDAAGDQAEAAREGAVARRDGGSAEDLVLDHGCREAEDRHGRDELERG